jgi:type IV secretion system protein VirB9
MVASGLVACAGCFSTDSHAAEVMVPVATDSRIKTFVYSENDVYNIVTHYGYQSNVEFGLDEEVETISVGDRVPFQIIPAGRRLFIRAMTANARTNMTVVTNEHTYQFDIASVPAPVTPNEELVYVVRFFYPSDKKNQQALAAAMPVSPAAAVVPAAAPAPTLAAQDDYSRAYNYKYTFSGNDAIAPLRVFDDGRSTYFKLRSAGSAPSFFAVDNTGKETFLASRSAGDYLAVDAISPRFNVKEGNYMVSIYNEKLSPSLK